VSYSLSTFPTYGPVPKSMWALDYGTAGHHSSRPVLEPTRLLAEAYKIMSSASYLACYI
jgi:hypothetical protein